MFLIGARSLHELEQKAFHAFATKLQLTEEQGAGTLPIRGSLGGMECVIRHIRRGTQSCPCHAVEFMARAPAPFAGGLVAYKPNFLWRLRGSRHIGDDIGVSGLLGFVHRDKMGDAELDKKLVIYADDPELARPVITHPEVKQALLMALEVAGHIRVDTDHVSLDVPRGPEKGKLPLASIERVQTLLLAARDAASKLSQHS